MPKYEKAFLCHFPDKMLNELRQISNENMMSVSSIIRQAINRHINSLKHFDKINAQTPPRTLGF